MNAWPGSGLTPTGVFWVVACLLFGALVIWAGIMAYQSPSSPSAEKTEIDNIRTGLGKIGTGQADEMTPEEQRDTESFLKWQREQEDK